VNKGNMKAAMAKNNDTQEKLAEYLGLQASGVCARINGKVEFRRSEIEAIKKRYNLSPEETMDIFFSNDAS
jgi:hypothetical protein